MSSATIISVENLSKRYVIGHQRNSGDGLRHRLEGALRHPFRWLGDKRSSYKSGHQNGSAPLKEEFWALKDVSFEVAEGAVVGIIGRNGAGKSTLLKILSRITEPTEGCVRLKGRVASLLEVGTGFHQELTGRENIYLNGAILGMSRAEIKRKFDEIVAFSEIERFLDTPVKRYSSGMYVRLAFAVAAHLEPEILIVDEVLAVGDSTFQEKCLGKMENIAKGSGRTVLFVSHNLGAVRRLCSHGIVLKNGTAVWNGSIDGALASYGTALSVTSDDMPDHYGRTIIQLLDVSTYVNNAKCDVLASGENIELRLTLRILEPVSEPLRIGIALESTSGVFTMINYSQFHGKTFAPKDCVISASIRDLPFAAGMYRLHVRILSGYQEVYWNTGVKSLDIKEGDFFGTGIRGEEHLCPWLVRVDWAQTS